jgi:hypothetical protein
LNFFTGASCPPFLAYLIFVHPDLLADRDQFWYMRLAGRFQMAAPLKPLNESLATPTAGPQNSMTAEVRRFCWRIWKGFAINEQ